MSIDRRINKSKNALKEALLTLMKKTEFKKITITEIVQFANLNRGTFYSHYQTKEDLLNDLIDDVFLDLIESYRSPYLDVEEFSLDTLTSSQIKIFEHIASYSNFYTVILNYNVIPDFHTRLCDVLKQLSRYDLELNHSMKVDINFLASYSAYAIYGLIIEWINTGLKYTPEYMSEQLIEILSYHSDKAVFKTVNTQETPNYKPDQSS